MTLTLGQAVAHGITLDSRNIYWLNQGTQAGDYFDGTVTARPLGGLQDGGAPTILAMDQHGPTSIVVDATNVYWTENGVGNVMSVPLDGGTSSTLASGQTNPTGIAVDSANVYWTNGNGTVMSAPLSGRTPTMLPAGKGFPNQIMVNAKYIYWSTLDSIVRLVKP